jgi:hypothetical protein
MRGDDAHRLVVVRASLDHLDVIDASELGIDSARHVGPT